MSNEFYGVNKGQLWKSDFSAVVYGTSTNSTDIELRVTTTNAGTTTGVMVQDVILALRQFERFLLSNSPRIVVSQIDPAYPGEY
jgi:hypothetical protein